MKGKTVHLICGIVVIIFSILFIYFGNEIATSDYTLLQGEGVDQTYPAVITDIVGSDSYDYGNNMGGVNTYFRAELEDGEKVTGKQTVDDYDPVPYKVVEEGDKVLLGMSGEGSYEFSEYIRSDKLVYLGLIFVALLLFFGRAKGFNTLISLVFTCLAVFAVFVPAVISGQNIYLWTVIICVYVIAMTLLIVNGPNRKALTAAIGCCGGVFVSGILTVVMNSVMGLSGIFDESAYNLTTVNPDNPINLLAIIFASITIGSMGAVMDISVDISASLHEIKLKVPDIHPKELFKSGMTIGRDLMGTMANTLVLAYIGSGLATTVLLVIYNASLIELLNKERVIVEIMQALIGSIGILLTLPFTAFVASIIYKNLNNKKEEKDIYDICAEVAEEYENNKNIKIKEYNKNED